MLLTAIEPIFADLPLEDPIAEPIEENAPLAGPLEGGSSSGFGGPTTTNEDPPPNEGSSFGGFGDGWTIFNPGGGGFNMAPTISGFDWSASDGIYQFFGYVIDDVDPAGLFVYFDGVISGAYAQVASGGYFSFAIALDDPSGTVSAAFVDAGGLASNQPIVVI